MKLKTYIYLILCLLILNSTQATPEETSIPAPIRAVRVESPVTINGELEEPVWQTKGYSGFQFSVNPSGSIIDGTLFNDEGQDTSLIPNGPVSWPRPNSPASSAMAGTSAFSMR